MEMCLLNACIECVYNTLRKALGPKRFGTVIINISLSQVVLELFLPFLILHLKEIFWIGLHLNR